jgi:hypothetical protein
VVGTDSIETGRLPGFFDGPDALVAATGPCPVVMGMARTDRPSVFFMAALFCGAGRTVNHFGHSSGGAVAGRSVELR